MKLVDFKQLKKIMQMTFSDNDNEALMAIRRANDILKKYDGLTWERVLNRTMSVINEVEQAPVEPHADREDDALNDAFAEVLDATAAGSFRDFILSLEAQWTEKHFLTRAQKDAVYKAAGTARRGSRR